MTATTSTVDDDTLKLTVITHNGDIETVRDIEGSVTELNTTRMKVAVETWNDLPTALTKMTSTAVSKRWEVVVTDVDTHSGEITYIDGATIVFNPLQ